jgi:hypothetical protein
MSTPVDVDRSPLPSPEFPGPQEMLQLRYRLIELHNLAGTVELHGWQSAQAHDGAHYWVESPYGSKLRLTIKLAENALEAKDERTKLTPSGYELFTSHYRIGPTAETSSLTLSLGEYAKRIGEGYNRIGGQRPEKYPFSTLMYEKLTEALDEINAAARAEVQTVPLVSHQSWARRLVGRLVSRDIR